MKKIILSTILAFILCGSLFAQSPVKTYADSVYSGDSTQTYLFANPYNFLRVVVTSSVANDTLFIYGSDDNSTFFPIGFKGIYDPTESVSVLTGIVATNTDATNRGYWAWIPGGAKYVKVLRSRAVTKVKYDIGSFH